MVEKFDSLNQLDPDLRQLVSWGLRPGSLGMSVAAELATMRPRDARRQALLAAIQYTFTRKEAQQLAQSFRRGYGSIEACIDAVLKTRPRVERTELILGAVLDKDVRSRLGELSVGERHSAICAVLDRRFPAVSRKNETLSPTHFSLTLTSVDATRLRDSLGSESLEEAISKELPQQT